METIPTVVQVVTSREGVGGTGSETLGTTTLANNTLPQATSSHVTTTGHPNHSTASTVGLIPTPSNSQPINAPLDFSSSGVSIARQTLNTNIASSSSCISTILSSSYGPTSGAASGVGITLSGSSGGRSVRGGRGIPQATQNQTLLSPNDASPTITSPSMSTTFVIPKPSEQALKSIPHTLGSSTTTFTSLPPLHQVINLKNLAIPQPTSLTPVNQTSIMKSRDGSPGLSSSDLLMNSFNVLEDGDPVRQLHDQQNSGGAESTDHQQQPGYQTIPSVSAAGSWSNRGRLDHNSNAILRALQEPQQDTSWKTLATTQSLYTSGSNQSPVNTTTTSHWNNYEQNKGQGYQNYATSPTGSSLHDLSTSIPTTQMQTVDERLLHQQALDSTSEQTLTKAVKETFCIAHFSCSHCSDKFRVPEKLAEHVKKVHSGSIVYTCFTCGKKFYNSYDLREHVASHANDPIKCSLCDLTLASSKELRTHHKKCHPMSMISCALCDKVFSTTAAHSKHLVIDHQGDHRLEVCDLCGDAFVDKAAFTEHMKNHPKKSELLPVKPKPIAQDLPTAIIIWKCDKCGHILPNDKELAQHKEKLHPEECVKTPMIHPLRNMAQVNKTLKQNQNQNPSDSRYELLRLLLARRMAASSSTSVKADPLGHSPEIPTVTNMNSANTVSHLMTSRNGDQSNSEMTQQEAPPLQSKAPDILSAATMQHVADELSMLEQTMDTKRKGVDQFLSNHKPSALTADMVMDGDSTIGINLAISKNASNDVKFKEIQKQKTLVNMLQGTVASIIEKEVKHGKVSGRIDYNIPSHATNHRQEATAPVNLSGSKQEGKPIENNNMIYENRNLSLSEHLTGKRNMLPPLSIPNTSVTMSQAVYQPQASQISQMSTMVGAQQQQQQQDLAKSSKCNSPWDSHIEPLLRLFQNVSSPPLDKQQDQGMMDLSSAQGTPGSFTQQLSDLSPPPVSGTSSGGIVQDNSTILPPFRDIPWRSDHKGTQDGLKEPLLVESMYSSFNTLSGGGIQYQQDNNQGYYTQAGMDYSQQTQSPNVLPSDTAQDNLLSPQQQGVSQSMDYQPGNPQQQHQLQSPEQDYLPQAVSQQASDLQSYNHTGYMTGNGAQQVQQQQHLGYNTTSPTQHLDVPQSPYGNIPTPNMQPQQLGGNYSPLPPQQSPSPQIQNHQVYSPQLEAENSINKGDRGNSRPIGDKATRAITEYLSNRNSVVSKRTIAEVPLVVRHKLLATMLNDRPSAENTELVSPNSAPHDHFDQSQSMNRYNGDGPLQRALNGQEDASYAGLITSTNNVLYETPVDNYVPEAGSNDNTYANLGPVQLDYPQHTNAVNRSMSEPSPNTGFDIDHPTHRTLSHSDSSTIDNQLLNQMMLSELPNQHISLPPVPNHTESRPQWSVTQPQTPTIQGHYSTGATGIPQMNYMSNSVSPQMNHPIGQIPIPVPVGDLNKTYGTGTQVQYTEDPVQLQQEVSPTKRRRMCPAIHKRKSTVVLQRVEDEYVMANCTVNVIVPKKPKNCSNLGCRVPAPAEPQNAQRMRGRPPKNGNIPVRKGSYKKGRYPCPVCGKFYAWKNYLRIHINKHEKKNEVREMPAPTTPFTTGDSPSEYQPPDHITLPNNSLVSSVE